MKSAKYRIKLERELENYELEVYSRENNWNDDPIWVSVIDSDEPLILWEFIDDTRLLIADWHACIWILDCEKKEIIFEKRFSSNLTGKAVLSEDVKKLHIIYKSETRDRHHAVVDLTSLEVVHDKAYPDLSYVQHCELYKDQLFLYHCSDRGGWKHLYDIIDLTTNTHRKQELAHPQFDDFDKKKPYLDKKNGKFILPYYTELKFREDSEQELIFDFQIAVFDINSFELEKIIPVREFPLRFLECYEDDAEAAAEKMKNGPQSDDDDEYTDAVHDLNGNLNSLTFDEDGKTFWLCWRGGVVRRVDYDGNMSPLYVKVSDMGEGKFSEPFEDHFNHSVLYDIYAKRLIILEHSFFGQTPFSELKGKDEMNAKIDEIHPIQIHYIGDEYLEELDMPSNMVYKWESMVKYNMF